MAKTTSKSPLTARSPADAPDTIHSRIMEQQVALIKARDQLRLQLNGVENQLFLIDQLLHPQPAPEPDPQSTPLGTI